MAKNSYLNYLADACTANFFYITFKIMTRDIEIMTRDIEIMIRNVRDIIRNIRDILNVRVILNIWNVDDLQE